MKSLNLFLSSLVLLAIPIGTYAAKECNRNETRRACFDRILKKESRKNARQLVREELLRKATPAEAPGSASVIKDFLPRLIAALGIGELSEENNMQTLSINLRSKYVKKPWLLKAVRRDPELFEPMVASLPPAIRDERVATLSGQLQDFDDIELSISYNIESEDEKLTSDKKGRVVGRSLRQYQVITDKYLDTVELPPPLAQSRGVQRIENSDACDAFDESDTFKEMEAKTNEEKADSCEEEVISSALREAGDLELLRDTLERQNYLGMADAMNGQPQVHFEGMYRIRNDLVGPDEWSLRATWEIGTNNVNQLREKFSEENINNFDKKEYADFIKNRKSRASHRFAFSAAYTGMRSFQFNLPADGFIYQQDGTYDVGVTAAYGRALKFNEEGKEQLRMDVNATYEDVSDDAMRNDRFVSIATLTYNMINNNVVALDVVYANKPEYLVDVDENLSARVGVKFKLDRKAPE